MMVMLQNLAAFGSHYAAERDAAVPALGECVGGGVVVGVGA